VESLGIVDQRACSLWGELGLGRHWLGEVAMQAYPMRCTSYLLRSYSDFGEQTRSTAPYKSIELREVIVLSDTTIE
jgi:hypothetical protein